MDNELRAFLESMEERITARFESGDERANVSEKRLNARLDGLHEQIKDLRADHGGKLSRLQSDVRLIADTLHRVELRLERVESR